MPRGLLREFCARKVIIKSMDISVKLLAIYRDKLPHGSQNNTCQIEVPPDTTLRQVVESFDLACDDHNVILLNGRVTDPDQQLHSGDAVCVFPALAGG
jgi:molybdopterin converting factor small subunit